MISNPSSPTEQTTNNTISSTNKIGFVSLGCPKALVDSERILTQLKTEGYDVVGSYEQANLVIVNTCGFIDSAKQESLDSIAEALEKNGKVIVTGCLGAKPAEIAQVHPSVLGITGPQAYEEVMGLVHQHLPKPVHNPYLDLVPPQGIKLTPKHYAYLKISEGCNHRCTFCIIPSMRGDLVSRPISSVLDEAERLVNAGVKEILVISQDTSAYGVDTKYALSFWKGQPIKTRLNELCQALGEMGVWVRLHYVYPYPNVDALIPLMANNKILPYLDIPFQHASTRILKAMKRPAHAENTLERIRAWREICPDITLRSTFIVGFPGETEEEFEMLLDFLDEAKLDRVGCFKYSPVEGAAANQLANPVDPEVQEERFHRFMQKQAKISQKKLKEKIGKTIQVLVDEVTSNTIVARSSADAPEIDGLVYVTHKRNKQPQKGDFLNVKVKRSDKYDLWADQCE